MKRLLISIFSGLITSSLLLIIVTISAAMSINGVTISDLGGTVRLLTTGILISASFAVLFRFPKAGVAEYLPVGLTIGVIAWVILALNIYPILMGDSPKWQSDTIITTFPQLLIYLLLGGLSGLLYGLICTLWPEQLKTPEPEAPIEITTRVIILGGGYAGVSAAETLERELADQPHVGIWLISQTNHLLHTPMLSEVSASAVNPQNISPPLRSFFHRVRVIQGAVDQVDLVQRFVRVTSDFRSSQQLSFDHLVLAVGGVPNFFGNKEVARRAFTFKSLEDAMLLRNQIIDMFERADSEQEAVKRQRMLTFVVAGGGFAGVELIGGINDFARGICPFYPNIPPEEIRFVLIHARERILPELSESLAYYAQEKLEQRGIEFRLNARVTGARDGEVVLSNEAIPTETLVWTAGNKASPMLEMLGLPLINGRIEVNTELAIPGLQGIWAAGDCAQIPDLSTGGFAPPTAQHALREGKVIGHNIAATIKGKSLKTFNFKMLGSLAALGHQLAVAEIFGIRFSGFLAWLMWRAIYLSKLPTRERQIRVFLDWFLDIFFPADIVQTINYSRPDVAQRLQERTTMIAQKED